ncbi:MAG: hypothetical protein ABI583_09415 [Betaproteobacteria bacterium]
MNLRPYSATTLALGGTILMLAGLYFVFVRPPLLPEDLRYMDTSLAQIHAIGPRLPSWLRRVFWVMGGYMFATGLLTSYVALTGFRSRARGAAGVALLAGLTSIGWMVIVHFIIASDFKWILLSFALPWAAALVFYCLESPGSRGRGADHIDTGTP